MPKNISISLLLIVSLLAIVSIAQCNTWCIPKPDATQGDCLDFLSFACTQINCQPIQPGGSCFDPPTAIAHAAYAMSVYYAEKGADCPNFGKTINFDPSTGSCKFPSRP